MSKHNIKVCMGSSCFARGNLDNLNFLESYIKENKFTPILNQIQDLVLSMQEVYLIPQKKGALNGNNKNMEI